MHPKLAHLTEQQIQSLIKLYNDGAKVKDLIEEFNIETHPSNLSKILPPSICDDLFCPYCKAINMVIKQQNRTGLSSHIPFCPNCKHQNKDQCYCSACKKHQDEQKRLIEQRMHDIIQKVFCFHNIDFNHLKVEELDLLTALFLNSLIIHSASEDLSQIKLSNSSLQLAPTWNLTKEIIEHLQIVQLITISPKSNINAFMFDAEGFTGTYFPGKVNWEFLHGKNIEEKRKYIEDLRNLINAEQISEKWKGNIKMVWKLIAKHELIEYFIYSADEIGMSIDEIGEKTHIILNALLEHHTISQLFYLIRYCIKETNHWMQSKGIPRRNFSNICLTFLQRQSDRIRANKWETCSYRRDYRCPQSVISTVFFNSFLKIGDKVLNICLKDIFPVE